MEPSDDDLQLLRRVEQGDEPALAALMERHKQALFRCVFRYTGNEADAAEITEETFFKVYQKAGGFSPRGSVKSWIFTIGVNLARDHLRWQKRRPTRSLDTAPNEAKDATPLSRTIPAGGRSPAEDLLSAEAVDRVEAEIRALSEKLRFPFTYCILEDHSYDDCAEVLQTNRKTVETRIYRARKQLREQLSGLSADI